jgi:hypothetical protein
MHLQCQIYDLLVVELTSSIKVTINHNITTTSNRHLPSFPSSNCYCVEFLSINSPWLYVPFSFLFVNEDSVGLYRYSFVDDGEQSSFAWPQKKKKKKAGRIDDPLFFVFTLF